MAISSAFIVNGRSVPKDSNPSLCNSDLCKTEFGDCGNDKSVEGFTQMQLYWEKFKCIKNLDSCRKLIYKNCGQVVEQRIRQMDRTVKTFDLKLKQLLNSI